MASRVPDSHRLMDTFEVWRVQTAPRWHSILGDDAGDVQQETYLRLLRAREFRFQSEPATLRYIEQVAAFVVRDLARTRARRGEIFGMAIEMGARGMESSSDIKLGERVNLEQLVEEAELTIRQRVVVQARRQGMGTREIGRLIGASDEAVRQLEGEAIKRLRDAAKGVEE